MSITSDSTNQLLVSTRSVWQYAGRMIFTIHFEQDRTIMLRTISNFKRLSGNFSPPAHAKITQPRFEILNSCPILLRMSCKDQRDGHQTPSALLN